jgi:hypothetical protein
MRVIVKRETKVPFGSLKPGDWFRDEDVDVMQKVYPSGGVNAYWPDYCIFMSLDDGELVTPVSGPDAAESRLVNLFDLEPGTVFRVGVNHYIKTTPMISNNILCYAVELGTGKHAVIETTDKGYVVAGAYVEGATVDP